MQQDPEYESDVAGQASVIEDARVRTLIKESQQGVDPHTRQPRYEESASGRISAFDGLGFDYSAYQSASLSSLFAVDCD